MHVLQYDSVGFMDCLTTLFNQTNNVCLGKEEVVGAIEMQLLKPNGPQV